MTGALGTATAGGGGIATEVGAAPVVGVARPVPRTVGRDPTGVAGAEAGTAGVKAGAAIGGVGVAVSALATALPAADFAPDFCGAGDGIGAGGGDTIIVAS